MCLTLCVCVCVCVCVFAYICMHACVNVCICSQSLVHYQFHIHSNHQYCYVFPCSSAASCVFTSSRSLAGCIQMAASKEMSGINLTTIRMLLLSDGANPCELTRLPYELTHLLYEWTCLPYELTRPSPIHLSLPLPLPHTLTGSLAASDAFIDAFLPKGLSRDAVCPCAGSSEALTVSLRRLAADTLDYYITLITLPLPP